VAFAPVKDTLKVTSVYQVWRSGESSSSLHGLDVWQATQRVIQQRMNQRPLILPAGSIERLVRMYAAVAELEPTRDQLEATRYEALSLRNEAERDQQIVSEAQAALSELERIRNVYHTTINSRRWRILGPPARAVSAMRGLARRFLAVLGKR
jgi:hypothetical protein